MSLRSRYKIKALPKVKTSSKYFPLLPPSAGFHLWQQLWEYLCTYYSREDREQFSCRGACGARQGMNYSCYFKLLCIPVARPGKKKSLLYSERWYCYIGPCAHLAKFRFKSKTVLLPCLVQGNGWILDMLERNISLSNCLVWAVSSTTSSLAFHFLSGFEVLVQGRCLGGTIITSLQNNWNLEESWTWPFLAVWWVC